MHYTEYLLRSIRASVCVRSKRALNSVDFVISLSLQYTFTEPLNPFAGTAAALVVLLPGTQGTAHNTSDVILVHS